MIEATTWKTYFLSKKYPRDVNDRNKKIIQKYLSTTDISYKQIWNKIINYLLHII